MRAGYGPQSATSVRPAPYPTSPQPAPPHPQAPPQYGAPRAPGQYGAPPQQQPQQQQQQQYGAGAPAAFVTPQQPGDPAAQLGLSSSGPYQNFMVWMSLPLTCTSLFVLKPTHTQRFGRSLLCVCQGVFPRPMSRLFAGAAAGAASARGPGSDFLPLLRANLSKLVATNKLEAFYPPQRLEEILGTLAQVDFRCGTLPQQRVRRGPGCRMQVLGLVPIVAVRAKYPAQLMRLSG